MYSQTDKVCDGIPVSADEGNMVMGPFDFSQVFYIDIPTTKWNSRVLYHIFKYMGVRNLDDFIWDPTEYCALYFIKDYIVYKSSAKLDRINERINAYHPEFKLGKSLRGEFFYLEGLEKTIVITGIDNWIQMEAFNGQVFKDNALELDRDNTRLINAMIHGLANYYTSLGIRVNGVVGEARTITDIACSFLEEHKWAKYIDNGGYVVNNEQRLTNAGKESYICTTKDAFRYITVDVKNDTVYIDVRTAFASCWDDKDEYHGHKGIIINRPHGAGYQLINHFNHNTQDGSIQHSTAGFEHCMGNCNACKKFQDIHNPGRCSLEGMEHSSIRCVGGVTQYTTEPIYPKHYTQQENDKSILNSDKKPIYNNAEESSEASNKLKTKTQSIMATPNKNTGLFEKMLNKYKGQYIPTKVDGLAMTMDGHIALASGNDDYTAIVDDHLETYPAEAIVTEIPFYSVQRPLEQVKIGDYVFLNSTTEGRKLAKVVFVNHTKDGRAKGLTVLRFSGSKDETTATTDKLTGLTTVEVVVNLFEGFSGIQDTQLPGMACGQQNPIMSMMLMKELMGGKDNSGIEKLLAMTMFMGGNSPFGVMSQPQVTQPTRKTRSDKGTTRKPVDDGTDGKEGPDPAE